MRFFKFLFIVIVAALVLALGYKFVEPHVLLFQANSPDMNMAFGSENPEVTVVEFVDYQCPHCYAITKIFDEGLAATDASTVRVVIRPVAYVHDDSVELGKLVIAAGLQNKGAELHKAVLANPSPIDKAGILDHARSLGIDVAKLEQDAKTPEVHNVLLKNSDLIQSFGFDGIPAFIIGNRTYSPDEGMPTPGQFTSMIEQVR